MPVSLSPTPVTGTGPPGDAPDQSATGPPGAPDQFATMLLQSGNAKSLIGILPVDKGVQNTAKPDAQTLLLLSALKNIGDTGAKPQDIGTGAPSKPSSPTTLVVTLAAAQNAMDTLPASLSSKDKSDTQKQDGELPLPTDQSSAPIVPAAPPVVLPLLVVPVLSSATAPAALAAPTQAAQSATQSAAIQAIASGTAAELPLPKTFAISSPMNGNTTAKAVENARLSEQAQAGTKSSQTNVVDVAASAVTDGQASVVEVSSTPLILAAAPWIGVSSNGSKAASLPLNSSHSDLPASVTQVSPLPALPALPTVPSPVTSGMAPSSDAILAQQTQPAVQSAQAILVGTQVKASATDDAKTLLVTGKAALTEKPLKTIVETADTKTVTNTRLQAITERQTILPELQSATAARQSDKTVDDPNSPLISVAGLGGTASTSQSGLVSPTVTTAPLSHAEQMQIAKQAGDGIGAVTPPSRPGDAQQMTIQLHPKDWGKLQVSVTLAPQSAADAVAGQKTVSAHIIVDSPQVKAALENQTGELRTALRSSGMHLDQITVSVQSTKTVDAPTAASSSQWQQGNTGSPDPQNGQNGQSGGSAYASFAGNSQGRNPGHSTNMPPAYKAPEPDDSLELAAPRQMMRGQIDTRA